MKASSISIAIALCSLIASAAQAASTLTPSDKQQIAKIIPGRTTESDVRSLLGAPWRVVQFNDCGMAMDGQADETWEYRGAGPSGTYRLHVEFGDNYVVRLIAKMPDTAPSGKATEAKIAPSELSKGMSM
jgi:hypothetical protein